MKKIIFIILTTLIFINVVNADVKDINDWQEEKIEGSNVEIQYRYKFYKEIKIGEYVEPNQKTNYQYEDVNDYIYGEYSGYQSNCEEIPYYEMSYKKEYEYKELLPIQHIRISNISDEMLKIKSIKIYNQEEKLKHKIDDFKVFDFDNMSIYPKGSITYYIYSPTMLKDIKILLEFYNENTEFELLLGTDPIFNDSTIVAKTNANSNQTTFQYDKNFIIYGNYGESLYSDNIKEDDFTKIISEKTFCKYRSINTFHYNIEKDYYDDNYYTSVDELTKLTNEERNEYKKDLENYKMFYRYKENEEVSKEEKNNNNLDINLSNKNADNNEIKLVKTGVNKKYNYKYLILYILGLILIGLILIKRLKKNVD